MHSRTWEITTALLRLSRTVENSFARLLSTFDIGFTDLRLMMMTLVLHGISQKELATRLGLSQVVVSTRLDRLERSGMISRVQGGRRSLFVTLTPSGKKKLDLLLQTIEQSAPSRALSSLDPSETEVILGGLSYLRSAIEKGADAHSENGSARPSAQPKVRGAEGLKRIGVDIDQVLSEENNRFKETMDQVAQELDALIQAYKLLRPTNESGRDGE